MREAEGKATSDLALAPLYLMPNVKNAGIRSRVYGNGSTWPLANDHRTNRPVLRAILLNQANNRPRHTMSTRPANKDPSAKSGNKISSHVLASSKSLMCLHDDVSQDLTEQI